MLEGRSPPLLVETTLKNQEILMAQARVMLLKKSQTHLVDMPSYLSFCVDILLFESELAYQFLDPKWWEQLQKPVRFVDI